MFRDGETIPPDVKLRNHAPVGRHIRVGTGLSTTPVTVATNIGQEIQHHYRGTRERIYAPLPTVPREHLELRVIDPSGGVPNVTLNE